MVISCKSAFSNYRKTVIAAHQTSDICLRYYIIHNLYGFTALLCIGETKEQKDYGISAEVLRAKLKIGLHDIPMDRTDKIWIAYEPVWSIGVNVTPASPEYAESMHKIIRETLTELFREKASQIPVLYGGSVNSQNADSLIVQPSIDGLFTGRAAWDADKFDIVIRNAVKACRKS